VKADEAALTGEPEPIEKNQDDPFMISGTTVNAGQGKMLVVAVGENSVSGKIKKKVYDDEGGEDSPLFVKLDNMAGKIGMVGIFVATVCFIAKCVIGFGIDKKSALKILDYLSEALGILAVAIPEGLPLAQAISLAFTSNKMSQQNNLVKTLDSCETMGSATTICTDKTGTLTTNRMTVRASYFGGKIFLPDDSSHQGIGPRMRESKELSTVLWDISSALIACCTMDESNISAPAEGEIELKHYGNPTECALLGLSQDLGFNYEQIRQTTEGRSEATRKKGKSNVFSSARKLMSWAVPKKDGGCRVYVKGAVEVILARCVAVLDGNANPNPLSDETKEKITKDVIDVFAGKAMRCIGLAYRDMDNIPDGEEDPTVKNTDGSAAFSCETQLLLVGIVGIEDPLRREVPHAIQQCYRAGVDVRMVTGDNLNTAIAIARGAGILRDEHFDASGKIKPDRAIEGKDFRRRVHSYTSDGEPIFQQNEFDKIWPYLRVMARSSPDDKLTLAQGLQESRVFENHQRCAKLLQEEKIRVFPDRQVVAMTGDGTNDAPALKSAAVGFAMGISGTQIAKDAANIILLDDNFASIVTAAKWGRNVYDSIQKFLQFQLTVNVSILVLSLIVSFTGKDTPLSITQMLWLNLIMDSLAALALASEQPTDALMNRPPVNRSEFLISEQMWWNMLGQSTYQVIVVVILLFNPDSLPDCDTEPKTGFYSRHYTIIFNTFVLMQLFNEYNSRKLKGEYNIFSGLFSNHLFMTISFITFALQVIMVLVAGKLLKIAPSPGLTGKQWILCVGLGAGPLVWQVLINLTVFAMKYFAESWEIRGLSELLKFGGPKHGDYRTQRPVNLRSDTIVPGASGQINSSKSFIG